MKKIYYLFCALLALLVLPLASCSKDDPDPDNPTVVKPDEPVDDPAGTITLSMRNSNNGNTMLDEIYMDNENFAGSRQQFASIGAVKGLGNVSYIPMAGWSNKVAVTPGNGYVAYDGWSGKYYRIYVTDYIYTTGNLIIGAKIKYQTPFKGSDEEIKLDDAAISFGEEGGSQALFFDNSNILVYSVESDKEWCHVQKATNLDYNFLYNGLVITVDKQQMKESNATVTVKTAYGKTKTIKVSYAGYEPYLTMGDMTALENVPFEGGDYRIFFTTNALAYTNIGSNSSWITTSVSNGSEQMRRKANTLKFLEGGKTRATDVNYNGANDMYYLDIKVNNNTTYSERTGSIFVDSGYFHYDYPVKQMALTSFYPEGAREFEIEGDATDWGLYIGSSYSIDDARIETTYEGDSKDWLETTLSPYQNYRWSFKFTASKNETGKTRTAKVNLYIEGTDQSIIFTVTQKAIVYYMEVEGLYENGLYLDKNNQTSDLTFKTNVTNPVFESSASWCTATVSNNKLVVRVSETTEDRVASVTCKNYDFTFTVHQSKYAKGDAYNENGIEGTVLKFEGRNGYIYKYVGNGVWSTETVETGCGDDGKTNMEIIKSIPNWQELYPAFAIVDALNTGSVSGWYFPGQTLTYEIATVVRQYGKYLSIWSSTEKNKDQAILTTNTSNNVYNTLWNEACLKSDGNVRWGISIYAVHEFEF